RDGEGRVAGAAGQGVAARGGDRLAGERHGPAVDDAAVGVRGRQARRQRVGHGHGAAVGRGGADVADRDRVGGDGARVEGADVALGDGQVGHLKNGRRVAGAVVARVQLAAAGDGGRVGDARRGGGRDVDRQGQRRVAGAGGEHVAARGGDRLAASR